MPMSIRELEESQEAELLLDAIERVAVVGFEAGLRARLLSALSIELDGLRRTWRQRTIEKLLRESESGLGSEP